MATNFLFDIRDHQFIYHEWLDTEKVLSCDVFRDYFSIDDINSYLNLGLKMAQEVVAPVNEDADKIGVHFEAGKVTTPPSFKPAYQTIMQAGLGPQSADRESEGRMPLILVGAINEMFSSACSALLHYWGLTAGAARIIQDYADEKSKQLFLPKMFSGEWGGTMNLTEPGAGSDVGDLLTKASPTDKPGIYKIKGNKQFITCGDNDIVENIIHLVLARIEGSRPGTAGISLFIVPKFWVNDDGTIGEFNDVQTVGVEHKMGYRGSATCALSYGENNGCYGILLGAPPGEDGKAQGMMQMFNMMNEERMNVGIMSLSLANLAYRNSVQYANQRVQGRLLTDPRGPRQLLINHEDIRRILMYQKSTIEAIRAMLMKTLFYEDLANDSPDQETKEYAKLMSQINIPLCKAYPSDICWQLIAEAIQVLGGYGYIEEYPLAQAARDCKIHSIWEGTSYIQSLDLVGRKFTMSGGNPFMMWLDEIGQFIALNKNIVELGREIDFLSQAFKTYQEILGLLQGYFKDGHISMMPLFATRILHATAMLYCAYLLLDQSIIAQTRLSEIGTDHHDTAFYQGKIASAKFYVMNVLPEIWAIKIAFESHDTSALDIPAAAF